MFHLSIHLITFGSRSTHLAHLVYKSGRKTPNILILREEMCVDIFHLLGNTLDEACKPEDVCGHLLGTIGIQESLTL